MVASLFIPLLLALSVYGQDSDAMDSLVLVTDAGAGAVTDAGTMTASAPGTTITPAPTATVVANAAAVAGTSPLPLTQYTYAYSDIPYQVNPYAVGRGPQTGYNLCNSSTESANSMCQTAILNAIGDFCIWGAPNLSPNETIGDVEAAVVSYCTRSGHGARVIPAGAITGVQWMKTSAYTQVVGYIDQTKLGLSADDFGGELDPHGADLLGNPLGGLVYSSGLPTGNNQTEQQVQEWNNFIGGGVFCFKICDPTVTTPNYCQNIYDLLGCTYNMPADYGSINGTFQECEGDLQDEVGTYTLNGQTLTWSQPSSLPATSTLPWTPRIPASSNCVTRQSADIFPTSLLGYAATVTKAAASSSRTVGASSKTSGVSASRTTSSSAASATKSSSATSTTLGWSSIVFGAASFLLATI